MRKSVLFLTIALVFSACNLVDNLGLTKRVLHQLEKECDCKITFQTSIEYDKSTLNLFVDQEFPHEFQKGKFVYHVFESLKDKGVYYDLIALNSLSNKNKPFVMKGRLLKKVNTKLTIFLNDLDTLNEKRWLNFTGARSEELETQILAAIDGDKTETKTESLFYDGIYLKNNAEETLVHFTKNYGNNRVIFGYSLKSYKKEIKTVEIQKIN